MSSPLVSSRGPPELPGLMAASVWITFSMGRPVLPELISRPAIVVRLLSRWALVCNHLTSTLLLLAPRGCHKGRLSDLPGSS